MRDDVSRTVFDKRLDVNQLPDDVFETLAKEVPSTQLVPSGGYIAILDVSADLFGVSKGKVRTLIGDGALTVNGARLAPQTTQLPVSDAVRGRWMLVRKGAREIALVDLSGGPPQ